MIFREVDPIWGVSVGGKRLSNLGYADDTALMAESETELQRVVAPLSNLITGQLPF